jgi:hypothetical protein
MFAWHCSVARDFSLKHFLGGTLLAVSLLGNGALQAATIENGDFATGDFTGWIQSGNTGDTWVCPSNDEGKPCNFSGFPSYANLGPSGSPGSLTQSFMLPSAGQYDLSFFLANGPQGNAGTVMFSASINGNALLTLNDPAPSGFSPQILAFTGNAGTNTLTFSFRDDPDFLGLTQIEVSAAPGPIPGAGLLSYLALGLLGVGSAGWKKLARNRRS